MSNYLCLNLFNFFFISLHLSPNIPKLYIFLLGTYYNEKHFALSIYIRNIYYDVPTPTHPVLTEIIKLLDDSFNY